MAKSAARFESRTGNLKSAQLRFLDSWRTCPCAKSGGSAKRWNEDCRSSESKRAATFNGSRVRNLSIFSANSAANSSISVADLTIDRSNRTGHVSRSAPKKLSRTTWKRLNHHKNVSENFFKNSWPMFPRKKRPGASQKFL